MIFVTEDTMPVACYEGVGPGEALKAYIAELIPLSKNCKLLINNESGTSFEWEGKKYEALYYLEDF